MMSKRHSLRALLAVGVWVMSQGLHAESKKQAVKNKTLQLLLQPADKKRRRNWWPSLTWMA